MEYINELNIVDAVVHVLENDGTSPILNNDNIILDDETYKFIYKNINKTIKDDSIKYARFSTSSEAKEFEDIINSFFDGKINLLEVSKYLASRLYEIMRGNNTIPSCDLLVADLSTDLGRLLGVIKLDFIESYNHKIKNSNIVIEQSQGLPVNGQKIQKAVFIKPKRVDEEVRMLVLDKRKKSDEEYGPNYFKCDFIHSIEIINERDLTKGFVDVAESWIDSNIDDPIEKVNAKTTMKEKVLKGEDIYIPDFIEEVAGEKVDDLTEAFNEKGLEEIEVDREWVAKKFSKVEFILDKNIKITMPYEDYVDGKINIKNNSDGSLNISFKSITDIIMK